MLQSGVLFSLQCGLQSRENSAGGPISVIWLWFAVRFKHLLLCFMLSVLHILRMYWGNKRIVSQYSQKELYARWCMCSSEDMKESLCSRLSMNHCNTIHSVPPPSHPPFRIGWNRFETMTQPVPLWFSEGYSLVCPQLTSHAPSIYFRLLIQHGSSRHPQHPHHSPKSRKPGIKTRIVPASANLFNLK